MRRDAPIAMREREFRQVGHALIDRLADFLTELPDRPVAPATPIQELRRAIGGDRPLPPHGTDAQSLMAETAERLIQHSLFNAHPRFWGYITAGPAPIGILGDLLASAINANLGSHTLAPLATEIEHQTIRWIGELLDMPAEWGGVLVSGGNMANLTAFWAARTAKLGASVRTVGMTAGPAPRAYVSEEAHTWVQKAADLSGMGTEAVCWIPTDGSQRMDVSALRENIIRDRAAGLRPFMVVGTAGTVSTGAIDPLRELAAICRAHDLWFHVDGAYGAFAATTPQADPELGALAQADSVAVDPHKWLYAPLDVGCVLVRDPATLRATYSYHPDYYRFDPDTINYVDYGLENSRPFRALKVWLQLQHVGREGYARMIGEDCRLAGVLHEAIAVTESLEARTCNMSIATFRFLPDDLRGTAGQIEVRSYLNRLNQEIQDRLCSGGRAFVSNAVVDGDYLLRACLVNFRTSEDDVLTLPDLVRQLGYELDARIRPSIAEAPVAS